MKHAVAVALAALALVALALGAWIGVNIRGDDNPWLARAQAVADESGWQEGRIDADAFQLTAFRRFDGEEGGLLVVYIEGDGHAWESLTELSSDPTPRDPRVLQMAVQDPAASVAYLARPCQYLPDNEQPYCGSMMWSLSRYASYIVAALDTAVDSLKREAGASRIRLVGVSGGGTLAALIAARRDDVVGLVTVAANLDHDLWSRRHNLSPLIDSLNAADVAVLVEDIPQVHFVGTEDTNVTRAEVDAYVARMADPALVDVVVVPGYNHTCCWVENWPGLLGDHPVGQ